MHVVMMSVSVICLFDCVNRRERMYSSGGTLLVPSGVVRTSENVRLLIKIHSPITPYITRNQDISLISREL